MRGERSTILRDARRGGRLPADEPARRFDDGFQSDQPLGRRTRLQERAQEARFAVPLMNRQTRARIGAAHEGRSHAPGLPGQRVERRDLVVPSDQRRLPPRPAERIPMEFQRRVVDRRAVRIHDHRGAGTAVVLDREAAEVQLGDGVGRQAVQLGLRAS
jgi:hypothetical protein